jgi:hypothetical protein
MICFCVSIPADSADSAGDGNYTTAGSRLTRSTVSSSNPGSTAITPNIPPLNSGLRRIDSALEGAGMGSPASSAASIQAAGTRSGTATCGLEFADDVPAPHDAYRTHANISLQ